MKKKRRGIDPAHRYAGRPHTRSSLQRVASFTSLAALVAREEAATAGLLFAEKTLDGAEEEGSAY